MLRYAVLTVFSVVLLPLAAQYDLGGAVGLHARTLFGKQNQSHSYATFGNVVSPDWNMGLLYREKHARRINLGLELTWMRQEFDCHYSSGGLAGSISSQAHVVLHTLNLAVLPEVRLDRSSNAVVRFGVSCGFRVGGSKSGYNAVQLPNNWRTEDFDDDVPDDFGGELRAMFGLGFRVPTGAKGGITIDPYAAYGFSSLLKAEPRSRSTEIGLRLGWVFRCGRQGLLPWLDKKMPTPPDGPNW